MFCIFIFLRFVAAHRGHTGTGADSTDTQHPCGTGRTHLPTGTGEKGAFAVDEARDRLKQWQNEKQRLQSTPQV